MNFPVIADADKKVANLYGMIHPNASDTFTVRSVFVIGADPVQAGLVASLNRPGGNVTGVSSMNTGLAAKQLGLLHQLLRRDARFVVLVNPSNPQTRSTLSEVQAAASAPTAAGPWTP